MVCPLGTVLGYDFNQMLVFRITLKSCIFDKNNMHSTWQVTLISLPPSSATCHLKLKTALVVMECALRVLTISFAKGSRKMRLLKKLIKNKEIFLSFFLK